MIDANITLVINFRRVLVSIAIAQVFDSLSCGISDGKVVPELF